jgi:hypothetical protein
MAAISRMLETVAYSMDNFPPADTSLLPPTFFATPAAAPAVDQPTGHADYLVEFWC